MKETCLYKHCNKTSNCWDFFIMDFQGLRLLISNPSRCDVDPQNFTLVLYGFQPKRELTMSWNYYELRTFKSPFS